MSDIDFETNFDICTDKKTKIVQFTGDITEKSTHALKESVLEIVNTFKKNDKRLVHLHISSDGGCLFSGVGLFDWITFMKLTHDFKLNTYGMGIVASAASVIFMAGDTRLCGRNSYFLIHALSTNGGLTLSTSFEESKQNLMNDQIIMNQLVDFYKQHTTIPEKNLTKMMKKDIYLTYTNCVKYGIDNTPQNNN